MISNNTNIGFCVSCLFISTIFISSSSLFSVKSLNFNIFLNFESSDLQQVYAFISDEGQFRCTNGSQVSRSSECPSSDSCPSSSEGNSLTQCITNDRRTPTEENRNSDKTSENNDKFRIHDSDIQTFEKHSISIFTDKRSYDKGEDVTIIVKNNGARSMTFSDSSDISITNLATDNSFPISEISDKFTLDSGASKRFSWNQEDDSENQVNSGKFRVSISIGSLDASDTFTIKK
jgi:hypothetical protein